MRLTRRQDLNATHATDLRLLHEAKERERSLWEREVDAALAHVKVTISSNQIFNGVHFDHQFVCLRFPRDTIVPTCDVCRRKRRSNNAKQRVMQKN